MFNFLKPVHVHLKVYEDKIELVNLRTGQSAFQTGKFSSPRMLIANFEIAQSISRDLAKELKLSGKRLKVLVQQMKVFEDVLTDTEKRALRDIAELIGAVSVALVTDERVLSSEEATQILKET